MSLNATHTRSLNGARGARPRFPLNPAAKWVKAAVLAGLAGTTAFSLHAQEVQDAQAADQEDDSVEIINVVGTRKTIQDQISIKRESTTVVDGLSADDIGDLPALSIGEALESITGSGVAP